MANYYGGPPGSRFGSMAGPMPYCGDHPSAYGSFAPPAMTPPGGPKYGGGGGGAFIPGQRRRINLMAVAVSLFVPWLLFCGLFAVMSFSIHYQQPSFAYGIVALGLLVPLANGSFAVDAIRRKAAGDPTRQPTWFVFLFITSLLAWILAITFGSVNFSHNMQPFYDVLNLNSYPSVDPSRMRGQQLMDAGRMVFNADAKLDLSRSMGFKNLDLYCVAPVTIGNANSSHLPLATYDFWAVGTDCCAEGASDFRCGDYNKNGARSAIRLIGDSAAPYYRLAVQQAEALHGITSPHPIFFTWHLDPQEEVSGWLKRGYYDFLFASFFAFVFSLFCLVLAVIRFSWIGRSDNRMDLNFTDDPNWKLGNQAKPLDMRTHEYTVA